MNFPRSKKGILEYYNQLIFQLAYPETHELLKVTNTQLELFTNEFIHRNEVFKSRFNGTGLPTVELSAFFSLRLLKQLMSYKDINISLDFLDEDGMDPANLFEFLFPEAEYEIIGSSKSNSLEYLKNISGKSNTYELLKWIIHLFYQNAFPEKLRNYWFDKLKLVTRFKSESRKISKSNLKIKFSNFYIHTDGLLKKFEHISVIRNPISDPIRLKKSQIFELIKVSQLTLMLISRETDPITFNNPKQLKYFELDRGFSIALFGLDSELSLPLESYVGYMLYKNGYPISYGGSWIFGKRALIGINIFDAFRGGESSFLFCQIMRTYSSYFGIEYFEVEPYQFGLNNKEGIKSGAFWFYYKLGFTPQDELLSKLAQIEFLKITKNKTYKSSEKVLKLLTGSYLELKLDPKIPVPISASELSKSLSQIIIKDFHGDRALANKNALEILQKNLKQMGNIRIENLGFRKLGLLFGLKLNWNIITENEKQSIVNIISLKGNSDLDCARELTKLNLNNLFETK